MANKASLSYDEIDRPYDNQLNRASDISEDGSAVPGSVYDNEVGGYAGEGDGVSTKESDDETAPDIPPVPAEAISNLWIDNWIKSKNYSPKTKGFLIDGMAGYIECMQLYVGGGGIVGGKLDIPNTTSADSWHVDKDGNMWSGCNNTDFAADNDNANSYILKTGIAKFQSVTLTSAVTLQDLLPGSEVSIQGWQHDLIFSATDYRTVAWTSGTITLMDSTTYSIDAGNTGNISAFTYIYLDINTSTTVLQTSTTAATAVGSGKIMVAVAENVADTNPGGDPTIKYSYASFKVFSGNAERGGTFISADNIAADAVTANEINVNNLAAINADMGAITAGTITVDSAGYVRGGQTDFATGTGWFIGYSGDNYKLSIGDSSNYITWDGTYLRISGSLDLTSIFNNISYTVANLPVPPSTDGFNSPTAYE